ncbi:hypothetical protein GOODEAATRI_024007 [Goodea atripinnis]|uniref:Uncharacterized protein n=1 Tax=Goodea atripinnis TaxID=208336 RepID=A0ABV0PGL0_9TELE
MHSQWNRRLQDTRVKRITGSFWETAAKLGTVFSPPAELSDHNNEKGTVKCSHSTKLALYEKMLYIHLQLLKLITGSGKPQSVGPRLGNGHWGSPSSTTRLA